LTEWQEALANEENYWFVVALQRTGSWHFHEYTPNEFMEFSYIPPFKIFFQVGVDGEKATRAKRGLKRVQLTRERASAMNDLYQRFRAG